MFDERFPGGAEYQFPTHLILGLSLKASTRKSVSAEPHGMINPRLLPEPEPELDPVFGVLDALVGAAAAALTAVTEPVLDPFFGVPDALVGDAATA